MGIEETLRRRDALKALGALPLATLVPFLPISAPRGGGSPGGHAHGAARNVVAGREVIARLQLVPPSPVTNEVTLDVRGAVQNQSEVARDYTIS